MENNIKKFNPNATILNHGVEVLKEVGITLNPTEDCKKLIPHREELYKEALSYFKKERELTKLPTTEAAIIFFRNTWLNNELKIIDKWLSKEKSTSIYYELEEYRKYINTEIAKLEQAALKISSKPRKLSIPQIALFCAYTGVDVTDANAAEIASRFDFKPGNLTKKYNHLKNSTNRTSSGPILNVSAHTRVKDMKNVADYLAEKGIDNKKVIEEIQLLEQNIKQDKKDND